MTLYSLCIHSPQWDDQHTPAKEPNKLHWGNKFSEQQLLAVYKIIVHDWIKRVCIKRMITILRTKFPLDLLTQVLSDMDDTQLAVLPPELSAEAQELRRDVEERHRRLLQERLVAQGGAAHISAILRHSGESCSLVVDINERFSNWWRLLLTKMYGCISENVDQYNFHFMPECSYYYY